MEKYNPKEIETKWQNIWADGKYGISENFLGQLETSLTPFGALHTQDLSAVAA